ncbi:conserved hypothetical protein [Brochothrix thermosphacta]|uniref:YxeA family protein n=1 Tax=Brochothrix thermosphacta TaxID=2756 RepID=UPI000D0EDB13|nr:conserved hypothetical protein [Brochothrix thermosphacta]
MRTLAASLITVLFITVICIKLPYHRPLLDRLNPTLCETTSYAKVPMDVINYNKILAYERDGKQVKYTFNFAAIDQKKSFVKIYHRGLYIIKIAYVPFKNLPKRVQKKLTEANINTR